MKLFKSRNKRANRNGFEKRNRRRSNRALRAELTIEAESRGIVTDEDVFDRVS